MPKFIKFAFIFLSLTLLFSCASIVVNGICAAQYPFEKQPAITNYAYSVSISYVKNGAAIRLESSMRCSYIGKDCNGAVGVYDKWESAFPNGDRDFSIVKLSDNATVVLNKPLCQGANEKTKKIEVFENYTTQSTTYSAAFLHTVSDASSRVRLLSVQELKEIYGVEDLVVEYRQSP